MTCRGVTLCDARIAEYIRRIVPGRVVVAHLPLACAVDLDFNQEAWLAIEWLIGGSTLTLGQGNT
jgi:hypothetical protein